MSENSDHTVGFEVAHGMQPHTAEELNRSLRPVIEAMPESLYGDPRQDLTDAEVTVLRGRH